MERVIVFIDGFNLYHAVLELKQNHLKWVDLWALSNQLIRPKSQQIQAVLFFTAFANWKPGSVVRHRQYIAALESRGVTTVMGKFKRKDKSCPHCHGKWAGHEEKETDVNIALYMLDLAYKNQYDRVFLISQDSDLAPSVRLVLKNFPTKRFTIVTTPSRPHSGELLSAGPGIEKAKIRIPHLERCLLPQYVKNGAGVTVATRPTDYDPPP